MKRAFTSAFIILLLATVSLAAPTTVYGPQKVQATPNSTTLNTIITNNLNNADGVLTIINGNGEDLSLKSCSKRSIFEFLACELENVAKRTFAIFDRPTLIEVSLNNRVIASSSQIPASMGKFQTSVKINLVNQLQIKVKGLWTASATFEIKAETQAPNQNPIAQLTTTPINGTAPLLVSFSGLASSDPDGDFISQYKWEFGDGGVATGPTPTHIFANPGTFSVKLTVVDNRGGQGSIIQPLTVQQNQAPSASFLATIGTVENELSVHFDASESQDLDGQITSFHFDFGDGATADTPIANHTYLQPGIYQVTLKVQDDKGTSSTLTKSIELRDTIAPILTLQSPTEGALMAGKTFVVTGASSERLSEARIQFNGDTTVYNLPLNSEQNGFSQSITLSQDGNRTLSITAKDLSGNQTSLTRQFVLDATSPNLTFVNPTSGTTKYTNALPYALTLEVSSSERLSQAAVNGQPLTIINNDTAATGLLSLATAGISNLVVTAKDIAGNESSLTETFEVIFDNRAPVVALDIQDKTRTALFQIPLSVSIDDSSPAYTEIKVNGEQTLTTGAKQFTALVYLNQEGENNIEVSSKDEAGNSSAISKIAVIRDSAGPVLSSIMPADNSNIQSVGFQVSASSNEELKSVTVNGLPAVLSTDKKSFSFTLVAQSQGPLQIRILAEDLLGNYSNYTVNVQIQSKVLIAELVSVVPAEDGQHLIVNGAIGASRPGAQIKAVTGLFTFNNGETNSNSDGSFQIKLDPFMSVTVTGKDLSTGEQDSTVINYGSQTRISGIVKSVDDVPLMGATVGIVGSTKTVHTDGNGAFALTGIPSGDQMLYIDGATIVIQSNDRKYSKTNVAVNIGLGQQNVMERPIYLAPLMLDGTQTPVLANSTTIVTSPNAPGVSLNIPANSASFPTGGATGNINISSVSADKSTVPVPESAVPTSVVTLEPSGLSFSQKVELTLPNDNELPAGVEMIILSMNSKKGQWEVDGLAKVSEDGNRIVTKPGYGISHFSLVYAVPIKPVIMEMSDKKIAGIDASRGSLSTGFQLPSFKSLGTTVTPSFVYKSAWANPTAVVTNWFDIPSGKVTATYSGSQQANSIQVISQTYCYGPFNTFCETDYQRYYINLKRQTDTKTTSWYQPESIKSQFFVSSLTSDSAVLSGNASVGTDPSGQQLLPGPNIKIGSASKIYEYKGIPNQSTIGYAVDLKDPATGDYLNSGVYPTLARYQIRLKNLTLTTTQYTDTTRVNGQVTNVRISQESQFQERKGRDVLPSDVVSAIIVQNKTKSPYGRGWHNTGASRILNPASSRLVIEEPSGDISTYGLKNPITTLFDASGKNIDLSMATDITRWPNAYIVRSDSNANTDILQVDLSANSNSFVNIASVPQSSGRLGSQGYYSCPSNYTGTFTAYYYPFKVKARVGGVIAAPNGSVYISNIREHSLWNISGNAGTRLAGNYDNVENVLGGIFNSSPETMNNICLANFGVGCTTAQPVATLNCSSAQPPPCLPGTVCKPFNPPYPAPSEGDIGFGDFTGDGRSGLVQTGPRQIAMNAPGSILIDPNGNLIIADTGNNRIRQINRSSNTIFTIVGTGTNVDIGENVVATSAGIFHPLALAMDLSGNLYFTTESGYIKKVDLNGFITTVAGLPLGKGGILADEAPAKQMFFNKPMGLAVDSQNNFLYVGDTGNNRVVRVDLNSGVASNVAGSGQCVIGNIGDLGSAITASLCAPTQVGLDSNQNLIIVDSGHQKIRRVNFTANTSGSLAFSPTNNDQSLLIRNIDGTWNRKYRDGSQALYDISGKISQWISQDGKIQQYDYNADGNLLSITDAVGQQTIYNYSGGKLNSIRDPAGRVSNFSYSGDFLSQISFPDGTTRTFDYDENGLLLKEQDQRGYATNYTFNEWKRLQSIKAADNSVTTINDVDSASVSNNYTNGQIGTLAGPGLGANQVRSSVVDAKNQTTEMAPDLNGYISTVKNALGETTIIERNLYGNPTSILLADGSKTSMTYDTITMDLLSRKDEVSGLEESFTYDSRGNILTSKNTLGQATTSTYDPANGKLISRTVPGGIKTTLTYNNLGLIDSQTVYPQVGQPLSRHMQYDAKGNVIRVYFDDGKEAQFTYDLAGNVSTATVTSGGSNQTKQYFYDAFNRLVKVQNPKGDTTEYSYLPTGQLSEIRAPSGKSTTFEYNIRGQLVKKTTPDGFSSSFTYDGNGNVTTVTDPNNKIKTYTYDGLNRVQKVQLPDDMIQISYNVKGSIIAQSNLVSQLVLDRDDRDRIVQATLAGIGTMSSYPTVPLTYSYNDLDQVTSMQSSLISMVYGYDNSNRIGTISSSHGDSYQYFYDNANRLAQINHPVGRTNYSYNASGTISSIYYSQNNVTKSFTALGYDERQRITSRQNGSGTSAMDYDANNQLTSMSVPLQAVEQFTYDPMGNRITDTNGNYAYDQNQDKLVEDWQYTYSYDNNGNLILKTAKTAGKISYRYNYNSKNQLIEALSYQNLMASPIQQVIYNYDVLGRRLEKTIFDNSAPANAKTRRYVYNGNSIIAELDGSNTLLATYTHSGLTDDDVLALHVATAGVSAGMSSNSGNFYYLKDHLGSVTEITNDQGQIVQKYEYSAFGKIVAVKNGVGNVITTSAINSPYAFTGREFDPETGLYYYRARYYDAETGRFMQRDPHPGQLDNPISSVNKYAYCYNNPLSYTDPSGQFGLGQFIGGLMSFVAPALSFTLLNTTNFFQGVLGWTDSDKRTFNQIYVTLGIITVAYLSGGWAGKVIAGGTQTFLGSTVGAGTGAAFGGLTGAIMYPTTGLGTSPEGFRFGRAVGLIAGSIGYAMWNKGIAPGLVTSTTTISDYGLLSDFEPFLSTIDRSIGSLAFGYLPYYLTVTFLPIDNLNQ